MGISITSISSISPTTLLYLPLFSKPTMSPPFYYNSPFFLLTSPLFSFFQLYFSFLSLNNTSQFFPSTIPLLSFLYYTSHSFPFHSPFPIHIPSPCLPYSAAESQHPTPPLPHLNVHLYPVLVDSDHPLHGRRVGEGEQEGLPVHLVHEVNVVPARTGLVSVV